MATYGQELAKALLTDAEARARPEEPARPSIAYPLPGHMLVPASDEPAVDEAAEAADAVAGEAHESAEVSGTEAHAVSAVTEERLGSAIEELTFGGLQRLLKQLQATDGQHDERLAGLLAAHEILDKKLRAIVRENLSDRIESMQHTLVSSLERVHQDQAVTSLRVDNMGERLEASVHSLDAFNMEASAKLAEIESKIEHKVLCSHQKIWRRPREREAAADTTAFGIAVTPTAAPSRCRRWADSSTRHSTRVGRSRRRPSARRAPRRTSGSPQWRCARISSTMGRH